MHPTQHSTIPPRKSGITTRPPWPRADDKSSLNPTVQQRRISQLVQQSAETLFAKGGRPHVRLRVIETQTGEAA